MDALLPLLGFCAPRVSSQILFPTPPLAPPLSSSLICCQIQHSPSCHTVCSQAHKPAENLGVSLAPRDCSAGPASLQSNLLLRGGEWVAQRDQVTSLVWQSLWCRVILTTCDSSSCYPLFSGIFCFAFSSFQIGLL